MARQATTATPKLSAAETAELRRVRENILSIMIKEGYGIELQAVEAAVQYIMNGPQGLLATLPQKKTINEETEE